MKHARFLSLFSILVSLAALLATEPLAARAAIIPGEAPDSPAGAAGTTRVIARFSPGGWPTAAQLLHERGAHAVRSLPGWAEVYVASFSTDAGARAAVDALSNAVEVVWVEIDGTAQFSAQPNDPFFSEQLWAETIDLEAAWSITRGSPEIVVAVIDSGVSRSHPDLQGKLLQGHDFLNGDNDPDDEIGHGTAVAGIIAASGNDQVGIAGVALESLILPVKVGSSDGAPISVLAQGIIWAVDQGAAVINLSLVTNQTSLALQDAILYALQHNVPVVTAAGNEPEAITYPGAYKESISVGASTFWGSVTDFSTRQNRVDVIAPGASVLAPWWSAADGNTWRAVTGTSFAAPMVTGTIALMLAVNPELTVEELRTALHSSALPVSGDTPVPGAGAGQLDAGATVRSLLDQPLTATWAMADGPVADAIVGRSWLWGPFPFATGFEAYADSPEDERLVRYYDKARMEITDPLADPNTPWYVTNGLIAQELISGLVQVGDNDFHFRGSSPIAVAGDPGDSRAPSYSDMGRLLENDPAADNALIVTTVDGAGRAGVDQRYASYGVYAARYVEETNHQIASVFWDFLNSNGLIYSDDQLIIGQLFDPVFFATGLPITEAYWAEVLVAGERVDVLIQCFERRCLTYTPTNAPEWRVELGNTGRHYFEWRYESSSTTPPRGGRLRG